MATYSHIQPALLGVKADGSGFDILSDDQGSQIAPSWNIDSSGNVTGLVGPDGSTHATLGKNVLTVGSGGRFSTLQEAIDYIESKTDCFQSLGNIGYPANVTAWNQGTSAMTVSGAQTGAYSLYGDIWFTHSSANGRYYLFDSLISSTAAASKMNRLETNFSGSEALAYYLERRYCLVLLDNTCSDNATISTPISVELIGLNRTKYAGSITIGAGAKHGRIVLRNIHIAKMGVWLASETATNFIVEMDSCSSKGINDGPGYNQYCGQFIMRNHIAQQTPAVALGHFIMGVVASGDIELDHLTFYNDLAYAFAMDLTDLRVVDQCSGRALYMDHVIVHCYDRHGYVKYVALQAQGNLIDTYISNSAIIYTGSAATNPALLLAADDIDAGGNSAKKVMISNSHIITDANFSGTKHAYKCYTSGGTSDVQINACGSLLADKPSSGTLAIRGAGLGEQSTGEGSAELGANCPAVTASSPATWKSVPLEDGSTGYIPVWK